MMEKSKLFRLAIVVVVGVGMIVYGGYDDSPGAQLLGLIVIIFGAFYLLKKR